MVLKRFLKLAENLLHPLTMHHFGLALFLFFHLLLVRTSMQSQVTCFCFLLENISKLHLASIWNSHVCLANSSTFPDFRSVPNLKHQNQQKLPANQPKSPQPPFLPSYFPESSGSFITEWPVSEYRILPFEAIETTTYRLTVFKKEFEKKGDTKLTLKHQNPPIKTWKTLTWTMFLTPHLLLKNPRISWLAISKPSTQASSDLPCSRL